jgi:hypothetical protein
MIPRFECEMIIKTWRTTPRGIFESRHFFQVFQNNQTLSLPARLQDIMSPSAIFPATPWVNCGSLGDVVTRHELRLLERYMTRPICRGTEGVPKVSLRTKRQVLCFQRADKGDLSVPETDETVEKHGGGKKIRSAFILSRPSFFSFSDLSVPRGGFLANPYPWQS